MEIVEALKLVIARSPSTANEALRTIQAVRANSPVVHIRYTNVLQQAFLDPDATFTAAERAQLADAIEVPGDPDQDRGYTLRVRLTETERARLEDAAESVGLDLSAYVRFTLFRK